MTQVVAKLSLVAKPSDGEEFVVAVEIGTPYQCGDNTNDWACPVSVSPLYESLSDQHGIDSYQALCLAIRLAQSLLQGFMDDGGELLLGGGAFPIEAYGFKPAPQSGAKRT